MLVHTRPVMETGADADRAECQHSCDRFGASRWANSQVSGVVSSCQSRCQSRSRARRKQLFRACRGRRQPTWADRARIDRAASASTTRATRMARARITISTACGATSRT